MQNPFESGHIKNYILLYLSVVAIMILFFVASTLFHDVKPVEKKVFESKAVESTRVLSAHAKSSDKNTTTLFKIMPKSY
jgi:hypothetical protein